MKIKFNVPAQIKNAVGKRETFKPGTYDLDEKIIDHWFIQGLIASGQVVILEEAIKPKPVKPEQQELPLEAPEKISIKRVKLDSHVDSVEKEKIEIEEIRPTLKTKKMDVKESIAVAPVKEVKNTLKRRKRV